MRSVIRVRDQVFAFFFFGKGFKEIDDLGELDG